MKKLLVCLVWVLLLVQPVLAFRPVGWVYANGPWAYDATSGDWFWFNTPDTQWVNGYPPANGWRKMPQSGLAAGWSFYQWPYAYSQNSSAWHYINEVDTQWIVNMSTGVWSLFGIPVGMVRVPGGTNSGIDTDPDFGAYALTVSSFCIDKYEVTKAKWAEVYTWAVNHGYSFDNAGSGKATNHPVHTVNWYDVVKWCNARSQKEGRAAVYTVGGAVYKTGQHDDVVQTGAAGYRLPTEVEWEYAARGGLTGRRFPWGDIILHARANYYSDSGISYDTSTSREFHPTYATGGDPYTAPVGSFASNGYGLYDTVGNVWEWCFDWNPLFVGSLRTKRGGSWTHFASYSRVFFGGTAVPGTAANSLGFRVCLPPGQ